VLERYHRPLAGFRGSDSWRAKKGGEGSGKEEWEMQEGEGGCREGTIHFYKQIAAFSTTTPLSNVLLGFDIR